jgi:iron complex outermembrane receptor protein
MLPLLVCALPAPGQPNESPDTRPALADAGTTLTTVVTGARVAHGASEVTVPQAVVQAAPRSGATDLLRLVPGLVASQHSGEGKAQQLLLRGFDAVHGQDVELNVAGLPVNEVSHIHALGYADLNWLLPEAVREVRVTEGSHRAYQGAFAVAGTVRYDLGLAERGLTVSAGYGSFNRFRLFAGVRPTEDAETFAGIEYVQADGFGPQRALGRVSLLGQVVFHLKELKLRAVLGSAGGRFDSPGVVRSDALEAGTAQFFEAFGLRQGGSSSRHQLLLSAELPHDLGRTTFELFGVLSDLRLRNNFTGFFAHPVEGDGLEQTHADGLLGARVLHRRRLQVGDQVVLVELGLSGRRDGIHQTQRAYRESDGTPWRSDVDATIIQTAGDAWTEVAWQPGAWRLMVGGRVDVLHYEVFDALAFANERFFAGTGATRAAFGAHWGLKAGVERGFGDHVRLFLSYGDGFRSPQARSLGDGERAPFVSVRGAELGAAWDSPRLALRLAAFGSYVDQDFFFDHTAGTTVSTGATMRGGGQAQVTAQPLQGWLVSANLTAAQARMLRQGALLPYFAPLVGRLDTSWSREFSWLGLAWTPRVGVGFTFIGPRPLPFDEFSRSVALLDARVALRVARVELRFDVQNLLDARWRDGEFVYASRWDTSQATSLLPARQFTAGTPRTLLVTLEVHL